MVRVKQKFTEEYKEAPKVAVIVEKLPSVTVPVPKSGCQICGLTEGVFETINNHLYVQHIDKILGSRISENWKGSTNLCLCHIREYKEKKAKLANEFVSNPVPKLSGPRRRECSICFSTFIRFPNDGVPPGNNILVCQSCDRKIKMRKRKELKRKCSICCVWTVASKCVEVKEIELKRKLNFCFQRRFQLDDRTLIVCSNHWNALKNREKADKIVLSQIEIERKKCCVCALPVDSATSVRVYDKGIKRKFNEHFGTKCVTHDDSIYFTCYPHWTEYCEKEEKIRCEQERLLLKRFSSDYARKHTVYISTASVSTEKETANGANCEQQHEERPIWSYSGAKKYTVIKSVAPVPGERERIKELHKTINDRKPCYICGVTTNIHLHAGVRITSPESKQKLNQCFGRNMRLNDDVIFLCRTHWNKIKSASEVKKEVPEAEKQKSKRVNLPSRVRRVCDLCGITTKNYCRVNSLNELPYIDPAFQMSLDRILLKDYVTVTICSVHVREGMSGKNIRETDYPMETKFMDSHLNSGTLANEHKIKEESVEEFGNFVKGYQSIDAKHAEWSQSIDTKDDMVNVEQLIGQGQSIGFGSELRESVLQRNPSEASVKEEIKEESA